MKANGCHGHRKHGRHGRHRRHAPVASSTINANTINVTNVTNVTSVTTGWHGSAGRKRLRMNRSGSERKPKLYRFCASGGLLDQDVASGMTDRELCDGFVDVGSYAMKGIGRTAGRLADDLGRHAKGFADNLVDLIGCLFG